MYVRMQTTCCYCDKLAKRLLRKMRGVHAEWARMTNSNRHHYLQKPAMDCCGIHWIPVSHLWQISYLSVSVMQAGVTCTSFSNYTAWKWQPEKKNHDLAPELAAYTLTWSFSYASHQCGRDSTDRIYMAIWSQRITVTLVACIAETPC